MAEPATTFVVHAHLYQPPRENPWTEVVPREPTAAPFHDWNARITAECYRPNGYARIIDDTGRVVSIVNNYEHLSFNVGPTLLSWMEAHARDAYRRMLDGDRACGGAMAQAYGHLILPLANERDARTQVRWGIADFEHRFGSRPAGMWLPECAVDDRVLAILVEEGIRFTVLAPDQAAHPVDTSTPYRWTHPDGEGSIAIVFYDGALSHDVAFGLGSMTSEALAERVAAKPGLVVLAADGETFGHHHHWGDRLLAYALEVAAPALGISVANLNTVLDGPEPLEEVEVRRSAWSCAHGVGRWREDCGCSTGGDPGWNQGWRTPLRAALDGLRDRAIEIFERRGREVLRDPWAARDAYIGVLLGATAVDQLVAGHVIGDQITALTLLESQRHAMSMYTSCGWFFNDIAGIETLQVLRYAARVMDLLEELGEDPDREAFLAVLEKAESNVAEEGTGRDVWDRHVVPSAVDARRTVGHLALLDLLEQKPPAGPAGGFDVTVVDHQRDERGPLTLSSGLLELTQRRTGRGHRLTYAALHLGGLEVVGVVRPAGDGVGGAVEHMREGFAAGRPVTDLLRRLYAAGDEATWEFGLDAALPEAAEELLETAARSLADRFAAAYARLFEDHRSTLLALADAGYPLPPELRAPGELALARRLEQEVAAQKGSLDPADYATAVAIAEEARSGGLNIDTPRAQETVDRLLLQATAEAIRTNGGAEAVDAAIAVLEVAAALGIPVRIERPQELVYDALLDARPSPDLLRLARALHLAL